MPLFRYLLKIYIYQLSGASKQTPCYYSQILSKHLLQCKRLTQRHIKLVSSHLFYACIGETNNRSIPFNKGKDRIYIGKRAERREGQFRHLKMVRFIFFSLGKVLIVGSKLRDQNQCLLTKYTWGHTHAPTNTHTTKKPHSFI